MLACATDDEDALAAVFPYLEYNYAADEYAHEVRVHALRSLRFHHGSALVQARLLRLFDSVELGLQPELTEAFLYCPDLADLRLEMLCRLEGSQPLQEMAALFVLANFTDPTLGPIFHRYLRGHGPRHALAALIGLFPILDLQDQLALEACRELWRPNGGFGSLAI